MSIRNLLVSYNATPSSAAALAVGILMARKYDAHLTGVLSYGPPELVVSYAGYLPDGAAEQLIEADRQRRGEVVAAFKAATAGLDPARTHFRDVFGGADDGLMEVARCHDLVIMGTPDRDSPFPHMEPHADVVARHSGRPVLVVPKDYRTELLSEHALVAWDGGRAAARAVTDAMSILETKSDITLLTIGAAGAEAAQTDVTAHLVRHGIRVIPQIKARNGRTVAEVILDAARDSGAGLIVMGAYEHSKFSEDLFGGVTASLLSKSPVPVLMSH